jgi:hypothetical protein
MLGVSLAAEPPEGPRPPRRGGPPGPYRIPAVQAEFERHQQALRAILAENMAMAKQIGRELMELKRNGAADEELSEAAKQRAPEARAVAEKIAAEHATHHGNLARILSPEGEARKHLIDQLALDTVMRILERVTHMPERPGERRPPLRRREGPPEGQGGPPPGAPENF